MNNLLRMLGFAVIASTLISPVVAQAQDSNAAAALYGQGVNAFFAGRTGQADMYLSQAMSFNPDDPRPYYFRAILRLRQGCFDAARGDMQIGAELEARLPNRYAIGTELQRIQGPDRLLLEEYRRNARVHAATAVGTVDNSTYRESDSEVLRERRMIPLDELLRPGGPRAVPAEPAADLPAAADQPPATTAPAAPGTQPPIPPQPTPTPTTPAPATRPLPTPPQPAGEDPFADDAAEPAAPPAATPPPSEAPADAPAATPPGESSEDPFSGL